MSDLISRQAAIDALWKVHQNRPLDSDRWVITDCLREIDGLPSAQPERKKGEWIIKDNPGTGWYRVTCSRCGEDVTSVIPMIGFLPNAKALWDFCPECGADMRGEQE